ncbi:cation/acetate symporter ActP [Pseudomonas moorei]|nr:cation/acetate symporter ActP [Pseudomonas moorei]
MNNEHLINPISFVMFAIFIAITGVITYWASKKSKSGGEYFTAGGKISAGQNALALSGEYLSAAALLGITGALALGGFKGIIYSIGFVAGWPLILFLASETVRRLGKYTLTDVIAWRLHKRSIRIAVTLACLPVVFLYLITQLVAGGGLIKLMFGLPYGYSVSIVVVIMLAYVFFGGMLGTTWVQIIKAVMLFTGAGLLTVLVIAYFDFDVSTIFKQVAKSSGEQFLLPPVMSNMDKWDMLSLAIAVLFGNLGMPHILSRFLTVKNAKDARRSAFYATAIISIFHIFVLILGFGALAILGKDAILAAGGGGNMAVPLLSKLLGGDVFFGFICAVSFATMLAVIAGLTLSAATMFAHDIWAGVIIKNQEVAQKQQPVVARVSAVVVSLLAVFLALKFEGQNVAFMVGLSYSIAASAIFPALMLAIFWRGATTNGLVAGMLIGALTAISLILLSPTVQVDLLSGSLPDLSSKWWFFPMKNPSLFSMPIAFAVAIVVSKLRPNFSEASGYTEMQRQLEL